MRVALYTGSGVGPDSRNGFIAFLDWAGVPWQDVTPGQLPQLTTGEYAGICVPGGWTDNYMHDVSPAGKAKVREFVASGGFYIGVCAGAYFASDIIRWEGRLLEYDLDLFKGLAYGPLDEIHPWRGWRVTGLDLVGGHDYHAGETTQQAVYWGGPAFRLHQDQVADVLATYQATGEPAAIRFRYGKGTVVLSGCHVELGWDEQAKAFDFTGGHGAQWPWLERVMRDVSPLPLPRRAEGGSD